MNELLTIEQIAALMQLSVSSIKSWQKAGKMIDPLRLSSHTHRWDAAEVGRWIAAKCPNRDAWNELQRQKSFIAKYEALAQRDGISKGDAMSIIAAQDEAKKQHKK